MDEKAMIVEQELREKAAKRKKRKKYKITAGTLAVLLVTGVAWYAGWGRNLLKEKEAGAVEIKVSAGQSVTYARITAINGNEITYLLTEETKEQPTKDRKTPIRDDSIGAERNGKAPMGETPAGADRNPMGEAPDQGKEAFGQTKQDGFEAQRAEEYITAYIPVGTAVTTKLGTVTTFSRLSAGDRVAIVTEEEGDAQIIMAVYIIG